jgi:sarcosine oxidase subunit gamma
VTVEARSPLADRLEDLARAAETTGRRVALEQVPFLAQVDVRLDPSHVSAAPVPLPLEPNTAWEEGARSALWLGPDEWLVLGAPHASDELVADLERVLEGTTHSVVDVSANRVALEVSGPGAKEVLSTGCSLDLDPRGGWRTGRCAQTLLARVPVILHERANTTRVLVRPSFGSYLVDWLLEATGRPSA